MDRAEIVQAVAAILVAITAVMSWLATRRAAHAAIASASAAERSAAIAEALSGPSLCVYLNATDRRSEVELCIDNVGKDTAHDVTVDFVRLVRPSDLSGIKDQFTFDAGQRLSIPAGCMVRRSISGRPFEFLQEAGSVAVELDVGFRDSTGRQRTQRAVLEYNRGSHIQLRPPACRAVANCVEGFTAKQVTKAS